jgi:hypothetical protein
MRRRDESLSQSALPPIIHDPTLSFAHPALVKAFAYWNSRRRDRAMPRRADITPQGMRSFLPHVALVEVKTRPGNGPDYFVRLAGAAIEEVFGKRTGRPLTEDVPPELAVRWRAQFDAVVNSQKPLRATGRIAFENKTWLEAEILCAPLSEDGTQVGMVLLAFAAAVAKPG